MTAVASLRRGVDRFNGSKAWIPGRVLLGLSVGCETDLAGTRCPVSAFAVESGLPVPLARPWPDTYGPVTVVVVVV